MKKSLWLFAFILVLLSGCYKEELTVEPIYYVRFNIDDDSHDLRNTSRVDPNHPDANPSWGWGQSPVDPNTGLVVARNESSLQPDQSLNAEMIEITFQRAVDPLLLDNDLTTQNFWTTYSNFEAQFADANLTPVASWNTPNGVFFRWLDIEVDANGLPFEYYSFPFNNSTNQLPDPDAFSFEILSRERTSRANFDDGLLLTGTFSGRMYRRDGQAERLLTNGEFKLFYPF